MGREYCSRSPDTVDHPAHPLLRRQSHAGCALHRGLLRGHARHAVSLHTYPDTRHPTAHSHAAQLYQQGMSHQVEVPYIYIVSMDLHLNILRCAKGEATQGP